MKRNHFPTLAALAWICAQAQPALAQTPEERAGARAAADQGYDAFGRGDWAAALDLFGRAESLVHSPVQVLFLARSQAKLEHLIEAQEAYLLVVRDELPATASATVRQARKDATRELAALEPRIPVVTVQVEGATAGEALLVSQDGRALPPALVGVARPLNPGEHTWQASVGKRQSPTEKRTVQPGTKLTLKLKLPEAEIELVPQQPAPVAAVSASSGTSAAAALANRPKNEGTSSNQDIRSDLSSGSTSGPSPWVYVGLIAGAAGVGVGTGYLLHQGNIEDRVRSGCPADGCYATPRNVRLKSDADRAGVVAVVGFTVGGVGLASALALWLLLPGNSTQATGGDEHSVQLRLGWNGASLSGRF